MEIFANIEIQNGRLVNLVRGRMDKPKVYAPTPLEWALSLQEQGAGWLNIVDLDGVKQRERQNHDMIVDIIQNTSIAVQVGGGVRTLSAVEWWLEHGASRVIIGTAAILDRHMLKEACARFPDRILIALDGKGGKAVVSGWEEESNFEVQDLAKSFADSGAAGIIFTDVDSSQARTALFAETIAIAEHIDIPVYASGMVQKLTHLEILNQLPKVAGCVIGYALCEKAFTLAEALEVARQRTTYAAPSNF